MTTTTVRNGIDVQQLLDTIDATRTDEAVGTFTFRAESTWKDGTYNVGSIGRFTHAGEEDDTRAQPFTVDGDEPPVLLGSNRGPTAVELVLQALGFCYAVGYVANAAAQGIALCRRCCGEAEFTAAFARPVASATGPDLPPDVERHLTSFLDRLGKEPA